MERAAGRSDSTHWLQLKSYLNHSHTHTLKYNDRVDSRIKCYLEKNGSRRPLEMWIWLQWLLLFDRLCRWKSSASFITPHIWRRERGREGNSAHTGRGAFRWIWSLCIHDYIIKHRHELNPLSESVSQLSHRAAFSYKLHGRVVELVERKRERAIKRVILIQQPQ